MEAENLEKNTNRRGETIRKILKKHMESQDIDTFEEYLVNLVHKITELKEMDQRIQLGEEQLVALNDANASANQSLCSLSEEPANEKGTWISVKCTVARVEISIELSKRKMIYKYILLNSLLRAYMKNIYFTVAHNLGYGFL